ncbi:ABC transporter substrate-binding protein [Kribbella sp. DT2]|uniref:ABC transporter substrate-binding protein n=1 Tax=Kribbella sp. DT2 TaxID=3393427 RepID=UPI003CF26642
MNPRLAAGLLPIITLTVACGATVEEDPESGSTVTVTNCGQEQTYARPQRPVAYDVSGTEKMFALGLADRMRGYVVNKVFDPGITGSPWKADYAKVERLGDARITKEIVVSAKADWVLAGWGAGFADDRGITPALLDQVGIKSYIHTETCFSYGDQPVDVPPLEALYTDLDNLGRIFGVEDRSDQVVADLRTRFKALEATRPSGPPARVFVYDSSTEQPYTAGRHAAPNDIITAAGGANIMADLDEDWASVGWESVTGRQPEVIVVVDYADQPAADKIAFLEKQPALRTTPAIRNNRFVVLTIAELVSSPRNIDAAEKLATYLRSIGR